MRKIFKFPIEITDHQKVVMPHGAKILCVQMQGNTPCIWAEVDPEEGRVERMIEVHGTGNPIPELQEHHERKYIGTVQMAGGALVWHVYEHIVDLF